MTNNGCLVLVEAKAHIDELNSKCTATSKHSIKKIKDSLKETHLNLGINEYDEDLWYNKFYQYGNRLAWYYNLKRIGVKVMLAYVYFVDDYTYIPTSRDKWGAANNSLDNLMLGTRISDDYIEHIYIDVKK